MKKLLAFLLLFSPLAHASEVICSAIGKSPDLMVSAIQEAFSGRASHLEELVKHAPNLVNEVTSIGLTPLQYAATLSSFRNSEPYRYEIPFNPAIGQLIQQGAKINDLGKTGMSPLITAIRCDKPANVIDLLNRSVDPNLPDNGGVTPIEYAITKASAKIPAINVRHIEMASELIRHGSNPNQKLTTGETILSYAIGKDLYYLVKESGLAIRADVNVADSKSNTPLYYAVQSGKPWWVRLILAAKPNLSADNEKHQSLLRLTDNYDILTTLAEHGMTDNEASDFFLKKNYSRERWKSSTGTELIYWTDREKLVSTIDLFIDRGILKVELPETIIAILNIYSYKTAIYNIEPHYEKLIKNDSISMPAIEMLRHYFSRFYNKGYQKCSDHDFNKSVDKEFVDFLVSKDFLKKDDFLKYCDGCTEAKDKPIYLITFKGKVLEFLIETFNFNSSDLNTIKTVDGNLVKHAIKHDQINAARQITLLGVPFEYDIFYMPELYSLDYCDSRDRDFVENMFKQFKYLKKAVNGETPYSLALKYNQPYYAENIRSSEGFDAEFENEILHGKPSTSSLMAGILWRFYVPEKMILAMQNDPKKTQKTLLKAGNYGGLFDEEYYYRKFFNEFSYWPKSLSEKYDGILTTMEKTKRGCDVVTLSKLKVMHYISIGYIDEHKKWLPKDQKKDIKIFSKMTNKLIDVCSDELAEQ